MSKKKRVSARSKPLPGRVIKPKPRARKPARKRPPRPVSKKPRAIRTRPAKRVVPRKPIRRPRSKPAVRPRSKPRVRRVIRPATPVDYPAFEQPWLRSIKTAATRRQKLNQLRDDVKALRQVFVGFEAKDGFDARRPERWSGARVAKAKRYGIRLRNLQAAPHVIVRPRTQEQRVALLRHVAQPWPNMKAFIIHTPHPKGTRVRYVKEPQRLLPFHVTKPAQLRVQLVKKIRGGSQMTQDFLFREILGYQPGLSGPGGRFKKGRNPWADMLYATRMLLPYMPSWSMNAQTRKKEEAWYTVISMPHDSIGASIRKSEILNTLREWSEQYLGSFAGLILGFRFQGTRWKAAMSPRSEMNQRERWRMIYKKERERTLRAMRHMDEKLKREPKPKKKSARKK